MSINSDKVKKWRKSTKELVIKSMGGKCVVCGYNKCSNALALHHTDPSSKEFSLGGLRAHARKWSIIAAELKKCILVCCNCHAEIHAGMISDIGYPSFDDRFLVKGVFDSFYEVTLCPICGNENKINHKYCSQTCANKSAVKIDWDNVDLKQELKTKSKAQIAEELGCSFSTITKKVNRLK